MSVYVPGHGTVGSGKNVRGVVQGYDAGNYYAGMGGSWSDYGEQTPGLSFNFNGTTGIYEGSDGYQYDMDPSSSAPTGDQSFQQLYKRRNDALNTYKNGMDWTSVEGWNANNNGNNYEYGNHPDWVNQVDGRIKTADKSAHDIMWNYNPETDMWDPRITGQSAMDTNASARMRNMAFLSMAAGGALAAYAAPAAAASTGTSTAVGGTGGMSMVPGSYGASLGSMSVVPGTAAAGAAPWAAIPGWASGTIGAGGAASGGILDNLKTAYDYYSNGKKIYNGVNQISNLFGGGQQGGGRQGMAQGSGGFLGDLYGFGSGLYSEHQNRESGRHLEDIYNRREQERQPYVDRLNQSYADNGRSFLDGEYRAAHDVEANRLARLGARGGTNANDIDRTRLLEAHGMKALADHRKGLTDSLRAHDLTGHQKLMEEAMRRNGAEGMFMGAGAGYGGGGSIGGQLPGIINGVGGQLGNWWDSISNWANGGVTGDAIQSMDMSDWFESGINGL
jgi:hypothetical protein